jgi:hypothetical protein
MSASATSKTSATSNSFPRRVGAVLALGLIVSLIQPDVGAQAASKRGPKRITKVVAAAAPISPTVPTTPTTTTTTPTVAPTTAATTTVAKPTTTVQPGKSVSFFFDIPTFGPGAPSPIVPVCTPDRLGCVAATITPTPGVREVSGDLIGNLVQVGAATSYAGKNVQSGYIVFSGTVGGCGVGTFVVSLSTEAPANAAPPGIGGRFAADFARWEVVASSGTKGLVGIAGSGTYDLVLSSPLSVRQTLSGRLVCSPPAP